MTPSEYLDNLRWDGVRRLQTLPSDLKGWMAGVAKRTLNPGCLFDQCLIVHGPQASGKDRFMEGLSVQDDWLCTMQMGVAEVTPRTWMMNLSLWQGREEFSELKTFLRRRRDTFRRPLAKEMVLVPRTFACFVTMLHPIAIGRQGLSLDITKIDIAVILANRDQLWAETRLFLTF